MILFDSKIDLEAQLLADINLCIKTAIENHGDARILLSGGNTPKAFYREFSKSKLDWSLVHIGLVDDRNVDLTSQFSNEKMIRDIFDNNNVLAVNIYSMRSKTNQISDIEQNYALFFERVDFCLLGMGTDGHTASLFPEDKTSESLLKSNEVSINYTTAPNHPRERITCSKELLKKSSNLTLMIIGEDKKSIFLKSQKELKPISYFVKECLHLKTYYSN